MLGNASVFMAYLYFIRYWYTFCGNPYNCHKIQQILLGTLFFFGTLPPALFEYDIFTVIMLLSIGQMSYGGHDTPEWLGRRNQWSGCRKWVRDGSHRTICQRRYSENQGQAWCPDWMRRSYMHLKMKMALTFNKIQDIYYTFNLCVWKLYHVIRSLNSSWVCWVKFSIDGSGYGVSDWWDKLTGWV